MSPVFDCTDPTDEQRDEAFEAAQEALAEGRVIVLPTDTVYGVAADPFHVEGVPNVLAAKQRSTAMPPPVLVPSVRTVDGLATDLQPYVRGLLRECWPGALTVVVRAQPSLQWDLGETNGTVALRMPDHDLALRLLSRTGPLAVTSANVTGQPAATTVLEAATQLGPAVEVYLDGGPTAGNRPSTIVDCTRPSPVVLRLGALSVERLEEVLGEDVHLRLSPAEPEPAEDREALEKELKEKERRERAREAEEREQDESFGRAEEAEQDAWLAELERRERADLEPAGEGAPATPTGGASPHGATAAGATSAWAAVEDDGVAQAHEPTASTLRTTTVAVSQDFDLVEVDPQGHEVQDAAPRRLHEGRAHDAGPAADAPPTPVNDDRSSR